MKRLFDIVIAVTGLVLASPIMMAIAILIKIESRGPIFYSCRRIGRGWKPFGMLKFRTMLENADSVDCKLCVSGDVRVTPLGRFLRRTKLNELPQIFNVLMGDMSVVGPRPEDIEFTKFYKNQWDVVLSVRPGIVGPNQIAYRNEEDLFPDEADPARFYLEQILPEKMERDVQYARNHTLWNDIVLLCRGIYVTVFKGFSLRSIVNSPQLVKQLFPDAGLSVAAYLSATALRYEEIPLEVPVLVSTIVILTVNPILFYSLGLYNCSVRFFSVPDLLQVLKISAVAGAFLVLANYFIMVGGGHSRTVFVLYPTILAGLLCSKRILDRILWERRELGRSGGHTLTRVVVYGAGRRGAEAVKRLRFETGQAVVGLLDDDPKKRNSTVLGVKVLGSGNDLPFLKSLYDIHRVVIAFASEEPDELGLICRLIKKAGIYDILIQPPILEARDGMPRYHSQFRQVTFADVLGLQRIPFLPQSSYDSLQEGAVAVFGAGDEAGVDLLRELTARKVERIVVIEDCEARLEKLSRLLHSLTPLKAPCLPIFLPPCNSRLIQDQLSRFNTKWIVYNPFNRPFADTSARFPIQTYLSILDAVQVVDLARDLGCDCFTFMSPRRKEGFSGAHCRLHLLVENYIRFMAREDSSSTRYVTLQPANILENENEVFLKACARHDAGVPLGLPAHPVPVTSACNAAGIVVNSFFLDYPLVKGRTLMDASGLMCDLRALIDRFTVFRGSGASPQDCGAFHDSRPWGKKGGDGAPTGAEMISPGILMRADDEWLDSDEMRGVRDFAVSVGHHYDYPTIEEFLKGLGSLWSGVGPGSVTQGELPMVSHGASVKDRDCNFSLSDRE